MIQARANASEVPLGTFSIFDDPKIKTLQCTENEVSGQDTRQYGRDDVILLYRIVWVMPTQIQ